MTKRPEQAVTEVSKLPLAEQDALADLVTRRVGIRKAVGQILCRSPGCLIQTGRGSTR